MTLQEFNSKYSYMLDSEQWGVDDLWEVITPTKDGYYFGDCESYILTLIDKVDGFKDLQPWFLQLTYNDYSTGKPIATKMGHCVGKDLKTGLFIDCNYQKFVSDIVILDGWSSSRSFGKFELWKGTMYGKLFKLVYKTGSIGRKVAVSVTNFLK